MFVPNPIRRSRFCSLYEKIQMAITTVMVTVLRLIYLMPLLHATVIFRRLLNGFAYEYFGFSGQSNFPEINLPN